MRHKFGDIVFAITEKRKPTEADMETYIGLEHLDAGDLLIVRYGSKVPISGEKLVMKKGDLLFGRRNTYLKRAAIAPHDGLFSAHGMIFRPKAEVVDPTFLPFFIASDYFFDSAIRISVGSISPTVNWNTLRELKFDVPPIAKQRRLAEVLWAAVHAREAYKRLLDLTEQAVKSGFVEMFGDPVTNNKGWPVKPLKEFSLVKIGPFGSLLHADDYVENGTPLINPSHIVDGQVVADSQLTLTQEKFAALSAYALKTGDVVLGRRGEIGRCAVVNSGEYICGTGSMFIRIKRNYLPMILQWILSSDRMRSVLEKMAVGITMLNLNANMVANLDMIMPPLDLQHRFAELVRVADKSKFAVEKQVDLVSQFETGVIGGLSHVQ